ncbi:AMP binding protein [Phellopilus nigrolimitatus]|nr:AMP binding protein [Phellopilus nigrolimitatus]
MAKIYSSSIPPVEIVERSVYTHLFPKDDPISGDHPAFIDAQTGLTLTRAGLRRASFELGFGLRNVLHASLGGPRLARGDTVLMFSPNTVAYPIVLYGAFAAGLRATLANSAYTARELGHQYVDSGAKLIFAYPALVPIALEMFTLLKVDAKEARSRIVVASWGLSDKGQKELVNLEKEENFDGHLSNETALLCYSSGTTGKPKGVQTTHRNLTSLINMLKPVFCIQPDKDVTLGVLPFYHIYGATNLLQYSYREGSPVVVMTRFEPVAFCKHIEQYKITYVFVVPPIMVLLLHHPAASQYSFKSLRLLVSGAAPLGAGLTKALTDRLRSLGGDTTIIQGYGLTETSPTAVILPEKDAERRAGSIGMLLPNLEARLVTDDGVDAKDGEPGELWLRGPTVMKGYLNNLKATKDSISEDGFYSTGDVAIIDKEGYFYIVDRKKELIKYKVFPPAELEALLLEHADIADVGVIGIDSQAEATELPRAYVVHVKGTPKTEEEKQTFASAVQKWVEGRVAKHKFLRGGVVVIDAIPKSAAGKILRKELRERAKVEIAALEAAVPVKAKL